MKASLRTYFITGLLVIIPIMVTVWVTQSILVWLDTVFPLHIIGVDIPGLGILISISIIFFAGVLGQNFIGNWVVENFAKLVGKIPFIGGVYGSLRQVMMTLANTHGDKFGRAVMVEFPKAGSWTVGFVTSEKPQKEISQLFTQPLISVFVPTTPNPTSGFFMYVPRENVKPLDMSVDDAFKVIVSLGLIGPRDSDKVEENR